MTYPCAGANDRMLDCNHDNYFHTSPQAGSYLATHWNTADSVFLTGPQGGGGGPAAPSGVDALATSETEILLTWDDVPDEDGYRIRCWNGADFAMCANGLAAGVTQHSMDGLEPDTEYLFEVCAYNGADEACATPVGARTLLPRASTRIVDDRSAGFSRRGTGWSTSPSGYRNGSLWTPVRRATQRRLAIWEAALDGPGRYEVWVQPRRNATTRSARYRIRAGSGVEFASLSQRRLRGRWVRVGEYDFTDRGVVELADRTGERSSSGRRIAYDAVVRPCRRLGRRECASANGEARSNVDA